MHPRAKDPNFLKVVEEILAFFDGVGPGSVVFEALNDFLARHEAWQILDGAVIGIMQEIGRKSRSIQDYRFCIKQIKAFATKMRIVLRNDEEQTYESRLQSAQLIMDVFRQIHTDILAGHAEAIAS